MSTDTGKLIRAFHIMQEVESCYHINLGQIPKHIISYCEAG